MRKPDDVLAEKRIVINFSLTREVKKKGSDFSPTLRPKTAQMFVLYEPFCETSKLIQMYQLRPKFPRKRGPETMQMYQRGQSQREAAEIIGVRIRQGDLTR
jgi:hypothetical protein